MRDRELLPQPRESKALRAFAFCLGQHAVEVVECRVAHVDAQTPDVNAGAEKRRPVIVARGHVLGHLSACAAARRHQSSKAVRLVIAAESNALRQTRGAGGSRRPLIITIYSSSARRGNGCHPPRTARTAGS